MAKQTLEFVSTLDPDAVAGYLEDLARGLRGGQVSLTSGEELIDLSLTGDLSFKLEAKASPGKNRTSIELKLDWRKKHHNIAGSALQIDSPGKPQESQETSDAPDLESDGEE